MKNRNPLLATASALLLLSTALPATALDLGGRGGGSRGIGVSAGSGENGGTSIGAKVGGAKVGVTLGGGDNIASTSVGDGTRTLGAKIGTKSGPLVGLSSGNGATTGTVNLGLGGGLNGPINTVTGTVGGVLDGVNVPGLPGQPPVGTPPGDITPGGVAGAIDGLGGGQIAQLKLQCGDILNSPRRYDRDLVQLCLILLRL